MRLSKLVSQARVQCGRGQLVRPALVLQQLARVVVAQAYTVGEVHAVLARSCDGEQQQFGVLARGLDQDGPWSAAKARRVIDTHALDKTPLDLFRPARAFVHLRKTRHNLIYCCTGFVAPFIQPCARP